MEEQQKADLARRELLHRNFNGDAIESSVNKDKNKSPKSLVESTLKRPEPPKKPSFCSEKATTQYVFDGCSVQVKIKKKHLYLICIFQGDNIYIGDNFVRKLTPNEQVELQKFDKQFTAYQKVITNSLKQVKILRILVFKITCLNLAS